MLTDYMKGQEGDRRNGRSPLMTKVKEASSYSKVRKAELRRED